MENEQSDIFQREQSIYDNAVQYGSRTDTAEPFDPEKYITLTREYGKILKQLRRITKISDRATDNLNSSKMELQDQVYYDTLTGIYNRRYLEETLKTNIQILQEEQEEISILMLDVDHFKLYNDTYGHSEGDKCLRVVAETISKSLTEADAYAARYGGEEFVVVLPRVNERGARLTTQRILDNIRALRIVHKKNSAADYVTISIGLTNTAVLGPHRGEEYIKRADQALYVAKQDGRDRYVFLSY